MADPVISWILKFLYDNLLSFYCGFVIIVLAEELFFCFVFSAAAAIVTVTNSLNMVFFFVVGNREQNLCEQVHTNHC